LRLSRSTPAACVMSDAFSGVTAAPAPTAARPHRSSSSVSLGRRLLQQQFDRWHPTEQDKRETISSAYSSYKGSDPNPTGAGDAFTYDSAEASATSSYNGVYYNAYDGGCSSSNSSKSRVSSYPAPVCAARRRHFTACNLPGRQKSLRAGHAMHMPAYACRWEEHECW
jgi:hypothetical protein